MNILLLWQQLLQFTGKGQSQRAAKLKKEELTLNTVEVNFKAWAQLLIPHPFKLLGQSVDCSLKGIMPLDLCFYCSGVHRFAVAGHPDTWIGGKVKQTAASAHLNSWLFVPQEELQTHRWRSKGGSGCLSFTRSLSLCLSRPQSRITTVHVSVSSAGLNWTEFTSLFQIFTVRRLWVLSFHTTEKASEASM